MYALERVGATRLRFLDVPEIAYGFPETHEVELDRASNRIRLATRDELSLRITSPDVHPDSVPAVEPCVF